jgi:hypothetical protein
MNFLQHKPHPWHGIQIGKDAPNVVIAYIEMVPTYTVKYEIDKNSLTSPLPFMALFLKLIVASALPNLLPVNAIARLKKVMATLWIFV